MMSTAGRNELSEELTEFLALKVMELSRKDGKSGNATSSIMAFKAKGVDGSADFGTILERKPTRRRADLPPGENYTAHVQAVAPIVLSHPKD